MLPLSKKEKKNAFTAMMQIYPYHYKSTDNLNIINYDIGMIETEFIVAF